MAEEVGGTAVMEREIAVDASTEIMAENENTNLYKPNNVFEELLMKNRTMYISKDGQVYYIVRKIAKPEYDLFYRIFKRAFDIFAAIIGGVLLLLPMLIIALAIKLDSKGPVFYKQERIGLNGKKIMVWKFRSMRTDAEANGARWASANDDRCTRLGAFLRKFHADELPQIYFNILPGNMSLVGPRSERECFYEEFATYIDGFEQRTYCVPGLTGYAQIHGGYDLKPEEKIVFDIDYIENCSIFVDLKILFATVAVLFNHNGAR